VRDVIRLLQEGQESICWLHQRLCALATGMQLEADQLSAFEFLGRYASMDGEGANQMSYVTGNLEGALAKTGDGGNPEHAVGSILSNIAYMFYFQTPDRVTTEALQRSLPGVVRPGWAQPLTVVPLATLSVGEAYYIAPGSRWGRAQFQPGTGSLPG